MKSWQFVLEEKIGLRLYVTSVKKNVPPGSMDRLYSGMVIFFVAI
jgi:hypothetical protein